MLCPPNIPVKTLYLWEVMFVSRVGKEMLLGHILFPDDLQERNKRGIKSKNEETALKKIIRCKLNSLS